jgi:hypothetical protein
MRFNKLQSVNDLDFMTKKQLAGLGWSGRRSQTFEAQQPQGYLLYKKSGALSMRWNG